MKKNSLIIDGSAVFKVCDITEADLKTLVADLVTEVNNLKSTLANARYVVETGGDSSKWYRLYNDGWLEQGGLVNATQYNTTTMNVSFLKNYKDTTYLAIANPNTSDHQGTWSINARCAVKQVNGMSVHGANNASGAYLKTTSWYTQGWKE